MGRTGRIDIDTSGVPAYGRRAGPGAGGGRRVHRAAGRGISRSHKPVRAWRCRSVQRPVRRCAVQERHLEQKPDGAGRERHDGTSFAALAALPLAAAPAWAEREGSGPAGNDGAFGAWIVPVGAVSAPRPPTRTATWPRRASA